MKSKINERKLLIKEHHYAMFVLSMELIMNLWEKF